jgi:phosphatidylserine/phosphatidylglycerophosphate/cardiolipin synthase-like enzyme
MPPDSVNSLLSSAMIADLCRRAAAPARPVRESRLLRDGDEAFPAMLELIGAARHSVCFENFIFAGDATGQRFARVLGEAVRRGVETRVLYDPVGTMMVKGGSVAKYLAAEGVPARAFRPVSMLNPLTWSRLRHRDHRKSLIVDGDTAVVGGLCISDNWAPRSQGGRDWRDTALLVRGPLAGDVGVAFVGRVEAAAVKSDLHAPREGEAGPEGTWVPSHRPTPNLSRRPHVRLLGEPGGPLEGRRYRTDRARCRPAACGSGW